MKYAILIGDGMADDPINELDGKTPLEYAHTPGMDRIARQGAGGLTVNVPDGCPPGSAVACMSIFGYNPSIHFSGRGPLEAGGMGIDVLPDEYAFRCNIVTVDFEKGLMLDYSAGHISAEEGREIMASVASLYKNEPDFSFYPGVSYRHLLKIKKGFLGGMPESTPPHDITEKPYKEYIPKGDGADILNVIADRTRPVLEDHPVNRKRVSEGKRPANSLWFWSGGVKPGFDTYQDRFGLTGKVISAVDLVRGIAFFAGIDTVDVPGITGYYDTNYEGKAEYAIRALEGCDIIFIHVEAPDEASHNGQIDEKIRAIENFDSKVVSPVFSALEASGDYRIAVLPDHYTPLSIRTHRAGAVPAALCGTGITPDDMNAFSEPEAEKGSLMFDQGYTLIDYLVVK